MCSVKKFTTDAPHICVEFFWVDPLWDCKFSFTRERDSEGHALISVTQQDFCTRAQERRPWPWHSANLYFSFEPKSLLRKNFWTFYRSSLWKSIGKIVTELSQDAMCSLHLSIKTISLCRPKGKGVKGRKWVWSEPKDKGHIEYWDCVTNNGK